MYFGLDSGSLTFNNVFGAVNVPSNLCGLFKCIHSYRRVPGLPVLVLSNAASTLFIKCWFYSELLLVLNIFLFSIMCKEVI